MKGSGYKEDTKIRVAHFPFAALNSRIVKRRRTRKRSLSKIKAKKKTNTKLMKNKRKKACTTVKRLESIAKRRKNSKKHNVSDIFS